MSNALQRGGRARRRAFEFILERRFAAVSGSSPRSGEPIAYPVVGTVPLGQIPLEVAEGEVTRP